MTCAPQPNHIMKKNSPAKSRKYKIFPSCADLRFRSGLLPSSHHAHWADHHAVRDFLLLIAERGIKRIKSFLERLDAAQMRREHRLSPLNPRWKRCGRTSLHHLLIHI